MTGKEQQGEDSVTCSLLQQMGRSGVATVLVEQPDRLSKSRRTFPGITTDALYRVELADSVAWWSVDVMLVPPARRTFRVSESFGESMTAFAASHGVDNHIDALDQ